MGKVKGTSRQVARLKEIWHGCVQKAVKSRTKMVCCCAASRLTAVLQGKDKLGELNDRFKAIGQQLFSDYLNARVFVLPDAPQRQVGMLSSSCQHG
jgi:hypothetical protein